MKCKVFIRDRVIEAGCEFSVSEAYFRRSGVWSIEGRLLDLSFRDGRALCLARTAILVLEDESRFNIAFEDDQGRFSAQPIDVAV